MNAFFRHIKVQQSNAPLVVFRILFGALMLFNTLRFWYFGWIEDHFINPMMHFTYYGFSWVEPLSPAGMYAVHVLMGIAAFCIMVGLWYRYAAALFFVLFTYCELIDLTYYLNHYYFISIVSFLMIWLPAHRRFSLDAWRGSVKATNQVSRWVVYALKCQIGIVYFYAGIAKINSAWLLDAMPLRIWLPANDYMPVLGPLFRFTETAYVFSWAGMLFDTTIVFFLLYRVTRPWAYIVLVFFHAVTAWLFQIGVFPLVMSLLVWIFFSIAFHERLLAYLGRIVQFISSPLGVRLGKKRDATLASDSVTGQPSTKNRILLSGLIVFLAVQLVFPWRYLLYPGNLFWTEEGYRFSWRVMLMEKAGTAQFFVKDSVTGREGEVWNQEFLNPHQEKQMSFQPDMILQFAHFLAEYYEQEGMNDPQVRCEAWVTLNGRRSRLLVDPNLDLTQVEDSWAPKSWIQPFEP